MSEEEKKAIETLKGLTVYYDDYSLLDEEEIEENDNVNKSIQLIIDLIENQQKELNSLKEIEQLHKEENGKLRVELEQEKEKNKELENQINFNKKTVEIAQTQILVYSQGYKDGLNKETTATAIVARELELNFIRQEIKHKYISKDKIKDMKKYREFELQQEYKEFEEDVEWRTYKKILEV